MPLPAWLPAVNKRVTNRITGPFAGHLPGFGIVVHRGRRSGRTYRTPVNAFAEPAGYVFALTYGSRADWVRNVLDAGGADLEVRGRTVHLTDPELFTDPTRSTMPALVRLVLGFAQVDEFLRTRVARPETATEATPPTPG
ncbi:MAG: nitroreductase family deazaflavin-dependent oxidoreductase [Candidatus Dormiibacterota bacterium]